LNTSSFGPCGSGICYFDSFPFSPLSVTRVVPFNCHQTKVHLSFFLAFRLPNPSFPPPFFFVSPHIWFFWQGWGFPLFILSHPQLCSFDPQNLRVTSFLRPHNLKFSCNPQQPPYLLQSRSYRPSAIPLRSRYPPFPPPPPQIFWRGGFRSVLIQVSLSPPFEDGLPQLPPPPCLWHSYNFFSDHGPLFATTGAPLHGEN